MPCLRYLLTHQLYFVYVWFPVKFQDKLKFHREHDKFLPYFQVLNSVCNCSNSVLFFGLKIHVLNFLRFSLFNLNTQYPPILLILPKPDCELLSTLVRTVPVLGVCYFLSCFIQYHILNYENERG